MPMTITTVSVTAIEIIWRRGSSRRDESWTTVAIADACRGDEITWSDESGRHVGHLIESDGGEMEISRFPDPKISVAQS